MKITARPCLPCDQKANRKHIMHQNARSSKTAKTSLDFVVEEEEIPAIIESGLSILTSVKGRIKSLTQEEVDGMVAYLDDFDAHLQELPQGSFNTKFHDLLVQLIYEAFIDAAPGPLKGSLLSVLAGVIDIIGNSNSFVSSKFLEQLEICLSSEISTVSNLSQWVFMRMVNCERFYQLRPIEYWIDLVSRVDMSLFQAVILAKIADRDPNDIGDSLAPVIARRLLVCLLNDAGNIDTVRYAALGLTRVVYYFVDSWQFGEVINEIQARMPGICDVMLRTRTRKIYTMMECFVVKGIARNFFGTRENVDIWQGHFLEALENGDEKSVTRLMQLLAILARERIWIPPVVFEKATEVSGDMGFKAKYWAVKLICSYISQFDCPPNIRSGFVPVLLDMIMVPAMDLMKEMLDCFYTLMDRYQGFTDMLINHWEDFGRFPDMLNEIEAQLDETQGDVGEAIENIRARIQREMPRSSAEIYRD